MRYRRPQNAPHILCSYLISWIQPDDGQLVAETCSWYLMYHLLLIQLCSDCMSTTYVMNLWGKYFNCGWGPVVMATIISWFAAVRHDTYQCSLSFWDTPRISNSIRTDTFNPLTPNDHYRCRTAPLTSKRCILYIQQI